MRGSFFDDEGTVHTWGLPGTLLVSMEFDDREEEIVGAEDGEGGGAAEVRRRAGQREVRALRRTRSLSVVARARVGQRFRFRSNEDVGRFFRAAAPSRRAHSGVVRFVS